MYGPWPASAIGPLVFSTSMPPAPKILRGTLRPLRRFSLRVVVPVYLFN